MPAQISFSSGNNTASPQPNETQFIELDDFSLLSIFDFLDFKELLIMADLSSNFHYIIPIAENRLQSVNFRPKTYLLNPFMAKVGEA